MTHRMSVRPLCTAARAALLTLVIAGVAGAQTQRQADVHANYAHGTTSKSNSWGAGTQLQLVFGGAAAAVKLCTSLGVDYLKQERGGPSQWNVSYDAVLQPGGNASITPYAGASIGENWSTGSGKQWTGAKLGLETLGGLQFKLGAGSSAPSAKVEERFGYVRGQEHSLTTRAGIVFSL